MQWYLQVLKKYAVFEGRARRKEYWFFALFNFIIGFCFGAIDAFIAPDSFHPYSNPYGQISVVTMIMLGYCLAILLPSIAGTVRRLHDTNRSGWWWLIVLIPFIGGIVLLVFLITEGTQGDNRYGPDPLAQDEEQESNSNFNL